MKKLYILLLLISPFIGVAQTQITTAPVNLDALGYTGEPTVAAVGEFEIFYSTNNGDNLLRNPIILVDAFDPGDVNKIPDIYGFLDFDGDTGTSNLADVLRAEGFDVVILNFPGIGGADYIERNAMILVDLINILNTQKAMDTATPGQNIIIGPSMGGLISRYALNFMESTMQDADTGLWISFDSPHLGANVPIGLQHQFNYLANNPLNPVAEVQPIIDDVLNSTAARQLLIDHFEPHLETGSAVDFDATLTLPIAHPFRTIFLNNINSLTTSGFPENVRSIAVTNGNIFDGTNYYLAKDDGSTTQVSPGFIITDTTIPLEIPGLFGGTITLNIDISLNMTPAAGAAQQVSRFFTTVPILGNVESTASSGTDNFDGVDAAPGGLFGLSAFAGDLEPGVATDFLDDLNIDQFSFIPTVSALGLTITDEATGGDNIDWYHDINISTTRATTDNTPFDNTFIPNTNEGHVELTQANIDFMLAEIRGAVLSTNDENILSFQLEKNPVKNELVLLSNINTNAEISIIDVTGKVALRTKTNLTNRNVIPVNLEQGFYILNVISEDNRRFTTKFLAN